MVLGKRGRVGQLGMGSQDKLVLAVHLFPSALPMTRISPLPRCLRRKKLAVRQLRR